jgi:predicted homoserine dehydrogenase-like protein
MAALGKIPSGQAGSAVEARRQVLKDLGHISEADLCESVIAANATGLMPDVPSLHGPIVRTTEIPEVLSPQENGGILGTQGVIDVVICLRRPDEAGLAGGVFIVFSCDNDYTWDFLQAKGIIASRRANYGLIYRPYHLLGVETPISMLCAGLLNVSTGGVTVEPRVDLVARAARDLKAGSILQATDGDPGGGPESFLEPLIVASVPVQPGNPLPLYLAAGNRLKTDVSAGAILSADMVEAPSASRLWALRREQDQTFNIAG